jgi:hypothetical protein
MSLFLPVIPDPRTVRAVHVNWTQLDLSTLLTGHSPHETGETVAFLNLFDFFVSR